METQVTISTETHIGIPWPDGVPLPCAGDTVLIRHGDETIGFVVESKFYGIGVDPRTGEPLADIHVKGKSAIDLE